MILKATFGSLATTPADTLERCCTPSGNNSGLTLRAPQHRREPPRPGNPITPADLGLRCPRLITLRHVVLHRVNSRILVDVAYACTLLSDFTLGSESMRSKPAYWQGRAKKITDWTELGWSERQV